MGFLIAFWIIYGFPIIVILSLTILFWKSVVEAKDLYGIQKMNLTKTLKILFTKHTIKPIVVIFSIFFVYISLSWGSSYFSYLKFIGVLFCVSLVLCGIYFVAVKKEWLKLS